jgi:hypothetical protein
MAKEKSLKLKLSLKKETLRELSALEVQTLENVVGGTCTGTCGCTGPVARTAPPYEPICNYTRA